MRPSLLASRLAAPGTDQPLRLVTERLVDGEPQSGWLLDRDGRAAARLADSRFRFVHLNHDSETEAARAAPPPCDLPGEPFPEAIDLRSARVAREGRWFGLADFLFGTQGDETDASLAFSSVAPRVDIKLHAHGWSGIAVVERDGAPFAEVDLFNREAGIPRVVTVWNEPGRPVHIRLRPTGRRNPASQGTQLLIEEVLEYRGPGTALPYRKTAPRNRGGRFAQQIFDALAALPGDALVLDIGGGRRQLADERYVNLDYALFDEPDVFGDALALPLRDGSVDFVYSAAVMEHVQDPHRFGAEVWRVLRPGGRAVVNSAFMQPVHSEGQHFFNATPYALDLVFARFADRRVWWAGNLSGTVGWMLDVAGLRGRAPPGALAEVEAGLRSFDALVPYERLMYVASGVWVEGRKD